MEEILEKKIDYGSVDYIASIFGNFDENLRLIEDAFKISLTCREEGIKITGQPERVEKAGAVLERLIDIAASGEPITRHTVNYIIRLADENQEDEIGNLQGDFICTTAKGRKVKCKTIGQKQYVDAIRNNPIVLGIGPAGTGKTFLAVTMAITAYKNKEVDRIVLTRPAVEAGEKLGFLPGDLQNKVDPYLRPLYDALYEMLGIEVYQRYLEKGIIEIAPLAYMRGRTLDDSFIILDEAQNTTPEQMKMFLTRIGFGSKAVVTGDITQIDLPGEKKSGLKEVINILKGIKGIEFVFLTERDVIRHELVQKIIKAYEKHEHND